MTTKLFLILLIPAIILFIFLNLLSRELFRKYHEMKRQAEREEALQESLRLDFTRESKTLKRVDVEKPTARILCVDDEEIILDSLRKILVLDGYSVDTVETGKEALGLIQTRDYDFVFTDLKMPEMSGTEVAKAVKHLRPDIDVVIITGFATVESAVECMKHGAMDYIEKPFTEDELRQFVRHALIKRHDRIERRLKPQVRVTGPSETSRGINGEFTIPGGVLVSGGHCWASLAEDGTVRIGADDFARKLIGHVDAIDLPETGQVVRAGEPLYGVRQGERRAPFRAPLSGKVVRVNEGLRENPGQFESRSYGNNWICVIEGADLDVELPQLKIGNSAVDFFQTEIERFKDFLQETDDSGHYDPASFCIGALEKMDDARWQSAVDTFFAR
jgi:CheY-like chemotaxis protein/glycine cleavage system H lipoate-binding protein